MPVLKYRNPDTGLYEPLVIGSVGPQGVPGPQGPQGPQGAPGPSSVSFGVNLGAVTGGTPVTVTHNLNTYDVVVQIVEKNTAGPGASAGVVVDATVELISPNAITVKFTNSASANKYRVTVLAVGPATAAAAPGASLSPLFMLGGL